MYSPANREQILKEKTPLYLRVNSENELYLGQVRNKKNSTPLKEGLGMSITPGGDTFHGIYKNDLRSHLGYLQGGKDSFLYVGEFDRGNIGGYGQMKKYSGDMFYVGGMKNNTKSGFGIEKSSSGWIMG